MRRTVIVAGLVWGVLFGGLSLLWAAGVDLLVHTLAPSIREMAERGGAGVTALLLATGIAKLIAGVLPAVLLRAHRAPAWLRWVTLAGGILLLLQGIAETLIGLTDGRIWYLLLWGPVWLIGGVTLVAAFVLVRRARADRRPDVVAAGDRHGPV